MFLEGKGPPEIYAPRENAGCRYTIFVPNNDMDIISSQYGSGKPLSKKPESLKTSKPLLPYITDGPVHYFWEIGPGDHEDADILCRLSKEVPVLGLGIDPVAVHGQVADRRLEPEALIRYIPDERDGGLTIQVPAPGLLGNAEERHRGSRRRLEGGSFVKPADITRWKEQRYRRDSLDSSLTGFMVRYVPSDQNPSSRKSILPDSIAPEVIKKIAALKDASVSPETARNIKTILLPSIGGPYADAKIRRVAFMGSGGATESLERLDGSLFKIGEDMYQLERLPEDDPVLRAYLRRSRFFASVTPVKLNPEGQTKENFLRNTLRALESEGVDAAVTFLNYQNTPYWGTRPEDARAQDGRYVELEFESGVNGPLMIGDEQGRGYGLFAPRSVPDVAYFRVLGRHVPVSMTVAVGDTMRRAAMAKIGRVCRSVPTAISGHNRDGSPLNRDHRHAFWLPFDSDQDGLIDHIAVYVPDGFDHVTRNALGRISRVYDSKDLDMNVRLVGFYTRKQIADQCPLFGKHRIWRAATPYFMPWHAKKGFQRDAQLKKECSKRGYKEVLIKDSMIRAAARFIPAKLFQRTHGHQSPISEIGETVTLGFDREVRGPVALGFGCHFGLGMFVPET